MHAAKINKLLKALAAHKAYPPIEGRVGDRNQYQEWVRWLARHNGVYVIYSRAGKCLYVGESHSGRLYDTLTRHFREWRRPVRSASGQKFGGTTYDANAVDVAAVVCSASDCVALQALAIVAYAPSDNTALPVVVSEIVESREFGI